MPDQPDDKPVFFTLIDLCKSPHATPAQVQEFVDLRVDVNAKDESGYTPLHYAANNNKNPEVAITLIEAGADVNAKSEYTGMTPLHYAARSGKNPEVVTTLIKAGAEVNAKTEGGWTPLHEAAFNKHPKVVTTLINAGADVNVKDEDGWTPLDRAEEKGLNTHAEALRAAGGKRGTDL